MLTVLDLFSGIGGISLGLERTGGFKTVAFCECDAYCQSVLRRHWPGVPVFDDVRELHAEQCGAVDVVVGGFPCQPVSVAGRRRGHEDERWLWPAMCRLVRELRPRWVLAENVPGLRTLGADRVLGDLEAEGYAVWPLVVGARHVGAPHRRDRVWIVGHAALELRERRGDTWDRRAEPTDPSGTVADARREGLEERRDRPVGTGTAFPVSASLGTHRWPSRPGEPQHGWEPPRTQPGLGRGSHGVSSRMDSRTRRQRLKALGNSVVPQVVELVGRAILAAEEEGK